MSEYVNQVNIKVTEITRLQFNHVMDGESDCIIELVCQVDFLPILAKTIQETYDKHKALMEQQGKINNSNKELN